MGNTSGEESKSGISSSSKEELLSFINEILSACPYLNIMGLMTIGAPGETSDFQALVDLRNYISSNIEELQNLELSMGMSNDFEAAIEMGSTNVRVGSTIFGARDYSKK